MILDSTALLYRKHVSPDAQDGQWQFSFPEAVPGGDEELDADDVIFYPSGCAPAHALTVAASGGDKEGEGGEAGRGVGPVRVSASEVLSAAKIAVVTYGNGVPNALQAIVQTGYICDVIDSPLVSRCPSALAALLRCRCYEGLLLVDVCREGGGPFAHVVTALHAESALPPKWRLLSATPSYNPLGRKLTFVSAGKIGAALHALASDVGEIRITSGVGFSRDGGSDDLLCTYAKP